MYVKICGITNLNDARLAASLGADELGFNFFTGSPRYVEPLNVRAIVEHMPLRIRKTGVFVNESLKNMVEIAGVARLDGIQLHGDESADLAASVRDQTALRVIKAFRISKDFRVDEVGAYDVDAVLLDAYSKTGYGGTGEVFDWKIATEVKKLVPKLYLAGGLSDANVAEAISAVDPYCIDACSCLESEPGIKDEVKLRNFLRNAGK